MQTGRSVSVQLHGLSWPYQRHSVCGSQGGHAECSKWSPFPFSIIPYLIPTPWLHSSLTPSWFPSTQLYLIPTPWLPPSLTPSWFPSTQLQKLGVIPFDEKLGGPALTAYQEMWGNNGDTISRQYTGTAAMKVHAHHCLWIWCHCDVMHSFKRCYPWIAGRHHSIWGEKVFWHDERWIQFST